MAKIPAYHQDALTPTAVNPVGTDNSGAMIANALIGGSGQLSDMLGAAQTHTANLLNQGVGQAASMIAYDRHYQLQQDQLEARRQQAKADALASAISTMQSHNLADTTSNEARLKTYEASEQIAKTWNGKDDAVAKFRANHDNITQSFIDQNYKDSQGNIIDPLGLARYQATMNDDKLALSKSLAKDIQNQTDELGKVQLHGVSAASQQAANATGGDIDKLRRIVNIFSASNAGVAKTNLGAAKGDEYMRGAINQMLLGAAGTGINNALKRDESLGLSGDNLVSALGVEQTNLKAMEQRLADPLYRDTLSQDAAANKAYLGLQQRIQTALKTNQEQMDAAVTAQTYTDMSKSTGTAISGKQLALSGQTAEADKIAATLNQQIELVKQRPQDKHTEMLLTHLNENVNMIQSAKDHYIAQQNHQSVEDQKAQAIKDAKAYEDGNQLRVDLATAVREIPTKEEFTGSASDFAKLNKANAALDAASKAGALGVGPAAEKQYSNLAGKVNAGFDIANEMAKRPPGIGQQLSQGLTNAMNMFNSFGAKTDPVHTSVMNTLNPHKDKGFGQLVDQEWNRAVAGQVSNWEKAHPQMLMKAKDGTMHASAEQVRKIQDHMVDPKNPANFINAFNKVYNTSTATPLHLLAPRGKIPAAPPTPSWLEATPRSSGASGKSPGKVMVPPPPPLSAPIVGGIPDIGEDDE